MFLKISLKGLYFLFESTFDPENFISVSKIFHPLLLETEKNRLCYIGKSNKVLSQISLTPPNPFTP